MKDHVHPQRRLLKQLNTSKACLANPCLMVLPRTGRDLYKYPMNSFKLLSRHPMVRWHISSATLLRIDHSIICQITTLCVCVCVSVCVCVCVCVCVFSSEDCDVELKIVQ